MSKFILKRDLFNRGLLNEKRPTIYVTTEYGTDEYFIIKSYSKKDNCIKWFILTKDGYRVTDAYIYNGLWFFKVEPFDSMIQAVRFMLQNAELLV